jgi:thioredoxin-related protein
MQSNVSAVLSDYPGLTVAVRSGNQQQITTYLQQQQLNWPVVNDSDGAISQSYGSRSVPALFFLNKQGQIVFTSIGYTSEWGLRFRLWLAGLL